MKISLFSTGGVLLALLAFSCTACDSQTDTLRLDSEHLDSGIEGQVLAGPSCPVVRQDDPCPDLPFSASFDVYDSQGQWVTRFQSDADGHFEVELAPGTYTIIPDASAPIINPLGQEKEVTVAAQQMAHVTLLFDTGIR